MKIVMVGAGRFGAGQSHYARLRQTLPQLAKRHDVMLIQLLPVGEVKPGPVFDENGVIFHEVPITFHGWTVLNIDEVVRIVTELSGEYGGDLVVLQCEVWDLVRELSAALRASVPFATVFNAMPFLTAPARSLGGFAEDVAERLRTEPGIGRQTYIRAHHHELREVMSRTAVIAANKTVAQYFQHYLGGMRWMTFDPPLAAVPAGEVTERPAAKRWDFLCMARFEYGKGLELLGPILDGLSRTLGRKVSCALAGNVEDDFSAAELKRLLGASGQRWTCDYIGWADEGTKADLLARTTVFLYPSYSDTLSIVVLEALLAGLPVVAWRVPYAEIHYADTEAVKLVPLTDTTGFAAAAATALETADQLSGPAVAFGERFGDMSRVAASEETVYRTIHRMGPRR